MCLDDTIFCGDIQKVCFFNKHEHLLYIMKIKTFTEATLTFIPVSLNNSNEANSKYTTIFSYRKHLPQLEKCQEVHQTSRSF